MLLLEAVEMCADPAVCRLYFVRDADAAGLTHVAVDRDQISGRQHDLSGDAGAALRDEVAQSSAIRTRLVE